MDAQNTQKSPGSQPPSCLEEKLNDEMLHDEHQTIPDAVDHQLQQPHPQAEQIPRNDEEPRAKKTYSCSYCDKTFSTHMALGGHQNAHRRLRALAKKEVKTSFSYPPYPYPSYPNYKPLAVNQNSSLGMGTGFITHMPSYAPPLANSVPPETSNTMFFGVQDFFKASSASGDTPSNEVGSLEDEDEKEKKDASGLDLDLKL